MVDNRWGEIYTVIMGVILYREVRGIVDMVYKKYRRYFASLSKIEGFKNWVIAKVLFKNDNCERDIVIRECVSDLSAEIKKQRKNYAVLIVKDDRINFEVHLMRIVNKTKDGFNTASVRAGEKSEAEFEEYIQHENMNFYDFVVFEKDEILDFVRDVQDKNPIHRTENAVVPGFLMLEYLLEREAISSCDIKYILPVFEGEKIEIYRNDRKFDAWVWHCIDGSYVKAVRVFELRLLK